MNSLTNRDAMVIECTRELVRAESLAGREGAAAAIAAAWMRRLGYEDVHVDEHGSVVGRIVGAAGSGPHIHLDGHLDTVPATAVEQWTHPPYGGELADGKIWGRGATDMKGLVAAMLCAAASLPREQIRGTISVSASVAEEEFEGAALAAILERARPDMVIVGESTQLQAGTAQKGRAGVQVVAYGTPAHSAAPHQGDNAVYRMVEVINRMRSLPAPHDELLGPGLMELVEIVSSPYPGTSIVPDRCTVRWDRRLVRGEQPQAVLAPLQAAVADIGQVEVRYLNVCVPCYTGATLQGEDFHPAWELPPESHLAQATRAAIAAVGVTPRTWALPFCTNASGSYGRLGIPSIVIGPGDPALLHVIDEYIAVDQLLLGTELYAQLLRSLAA
jgi:putative selenium metabolism hydrolase